MRILIGLIVTSISILIFGWWGALSLILVLPFIGWQDRHKGPFPTRQRWSICFSFKDDVKYELTHERAGVLLGFVMNKFYECKRTKEGWEIHLVFNKKNTAIKLSEEYFKNDQKPENELYIIIGSIDPKYSTFGNSSDNPIFFSRTPFQLIPIQSGHSIVEMIENPEVRNSQLTYYQIVDKIFC
jgi:hypothetical protein